MKNCIKNGYVQTLMGRRRYLPGITNSNTHVKAHVSMHVHQKLARMDVQAGHYEINMIFSFIPHSGRASGGEHNRAGFGGGHC